MGGSGSGRWGMAQTKQDTEGLLRLDVRYLARNGYLAAQVGEEAVGTLVWSCQNRPVGEIVVRYRGDQPQVLTLEYTVRRRVGAPLEVVREQIALERTACRYGGERVWVQCPGVEKRRAVLYEVRGSFRCRVCQALAYTSTREDQGERMMRRAAEVRRRLGGGPDGNLWDIPPQPAGMHGRTYHQRVKALLAYQGVAADEMAAASERLIARWSQITGEEGPAS